MFGSLRYILAALVALSHINMRIDGLNLGVSSVVVFYLLTGYVMAAQLRGRFGGAGRIPSFYLDRVLRIFPAYLFFATLTLLWFILEQQTTSFLQRSPNIADLLNNLTIIPLNYYMFNQADQFMLLPAAWSLGAELQFYLLIPILFIIPGLRSFALVLSLSLFLFASLGKVNSEWFGYRLLPGVLVIFLTGGYIYEYIQQRPHARFALISVLISLLIIAVSIQLSALWHLPYSREVFIGLAFGIPVVTLLARLPRRDWDEWLGHLSYGVFLAHFLWIWTAGTWLGSIALQPILLLLGSTALAAIGIFLVEMPVTRWRHRLRI